MDTPLPYIKNTIYRQISLNGHLQDGNLYCTYKTDTWFWSRPCHSHFAITKLSKSIQFNSIQYLFRLRKIFT